MTLAVDEALGPKKPNQTKPTKLYTEPELA